MTKGRCRQILSDAFRTTGESHPPTFRRGGGDGWWPGKPFILMRLQCSVRMRCFFLLLTENEKKKPMIVGSFRVYLDAFDTSNVARIAKI